MDNTSQPANSAILSFTIGDANFNMIKVEGGSFWMGAQNSNPDEVNYDKYAGRTDDWDEGRDESPVHQVSIDDFYLGETEVNQKLWEAVMGNNPSHHVAAQWNLPVDSVSWYDCQKFIEKLNSITGKSFRLPTEAEWEYAAIGGKSGRRFKYSGSDELTDVAWMTDNNGVKTHLLKAKAPNALGLYDMTGNVWEWCDDWYGSYDPSKPQSSKRKVLRGGGWLNEPSYFRNTYRELAFPNSKYYCFGLRLALSKP